MSPRIEDQKVDRDNRLHLVVSDAAVGEVEVDDRDEGDDSEPYATPPR
jgi:hypothetical protein